MLMKNECSQLIHAGQGMEANGPDTAQIYIFRHECRAGTINLASNIARFIAVSVSWLISPLKSSHF
jgi:hypothetical protein